MKRSWFGLAVVLVCTCGGNSEQETSLRLIVNNGPGLSVPVEVNVDVFEGTSQMVRDSITRGVPKGATTRLGDVVVYPAPGTLVLRFVINGRAEGKIVSSTVISAAPQEGKQVEVIATLKGGQNSMPDVDGGVGTDASDAGAKDTGGMPAKQPGAACATGAECSSGACLYNVCCDRSCAGACNTCKAAGRPLGMCTALAEGTKCADATCSGNRRTLSQNLCRAGICVQEELSCATRNCAAATLMCN